MKTNSIRVVAGAIPIYQGNNRKEYVLVLSKENKYIFPKGAVKKNETLQETAARESLEEAGVKGIIKEKSYRGKNNIIYFILEVITILDNFEEAERRKRHLFTAEDIKLDNRVANYVKDLINQLDIL